MRIAYIHQYFARAADAGGTRSLEIARRLVERGHQVDMITSDRTGTVPLGRWRVSDEAGIRVHWVGVPYRNRMGSLSRLGAFGAFAACASVRAMQLPSDVVLATSTPLTVAIPGVAASLGRGVPMVFEVRDLWPEVPIAVGALEDPRARKIARALERWAYDHAQEIIALSPGMKAGVERAGVPGERVTVIPNACDVGQFGDARADGEAWRASHEWLGARPLVVYAGTLGWANDVPWLARLAARVRALDPEIRFAVIGDGAEHQKIIAEADALGVLGDNFFVLRPVPKSRMPAVLAAATVCTSLFRDIPALEHNSANKFFDALAAGRPVVINYGGWQADLLESEGAGMAIERNDLDGAAKRLVDLVRDPTRLEAHGRAARGVAEHRFARDELARAFESVLLRATA